MQISQNQTISNIVNPSFQAKNIKTAESVMRDFETRISNPRSQLKDKEMLRTIMKLLLKGFKVEPLAEMFNKSKAKIYKISADYNAHKVYIQNRDNIIKKRLLKNDSREKIAKEMDVDLRTVQSVADRYKTWQTYHTKRDNLIKERYLSGVSTNEIAKEVGVDPITVLRALKRLGVKRS